MRTELVRALASKARRFRRPWIAAGTVLAGAALIVVGWRIHVGLRPTASPGSGRSYLASLLLGLGVTVLLVLPLLWIERIFERRVEASETETRAQVAGVAEDLAEVTERLEETAHSLADVREELRGRLTAAAEADSNLAQRARDDVSLATVAALLVRADELAALSGDGLRVAVPGQWERLRFHLFNPLGLGKIGGTIQPVINVGVEDVRGEPSGISTVWSRGKTALDALLEIAEAWKRAGSYPGDSAIDAEWIFDKLITSLDIAIEGRRTRGDDQLSPMIEMVSSKWAMTDYGLEYVPEYYAIPKEDLATSQGLGEWRAHMREKVWVENDDASARSSSSEPDFWMISQIAHVFFAAQVSDD